jgi:tRNA threonylcarbamoyladenosine biosynthesis protein TsaE
MAHASTRVSQLNIADISALERFAAAFALDLRPGDVVALKGALGSGKTTFVAALVRALDNPADVASPTFTFWHRYGGSPSLEHLDLFRLENAAEARELGLEEAFGPDRITFVEWPEQLPGLLPEGAIRLHFAGSGDGPRVVTIERPGDGGAA